MRFAETDRAGWWHARDVTLRGADRVAGFPLPLLVARAPGPRRRGAARRPPDPGRLDRRADHDVGGSGSPDLATRGEPAAAVIPSGHAADAIQGVADHPVGDATDLRFGMPEEMRRRLNGTPGIAAGFAARRTSGRANRTRGDGLGTNREIDETTATQGEIRVDDFFADRPCGRARPRGARAATLQPPGKPPLPRLAHRTVVGIL